MAIIKKSTFRLLMNTMFMIFTDPVLEEKFREKQNEHTVRYNRTVCFLGVILYSSSYLMQYYITSYYDIRYLVIPWSFGFAAFIFALIILMSNVHYNAMQFSLFISLIFIVGTCMITVNGLMPPYSYIQSGAVSLIAIASFAFCRLRFFYSFFLAICFFIMHKLIFQCLPNGGPGQFILIEYIFLCSLIVGLSANYNIERQERHNFLKLLIIVEDRMKLTNFR